MRIPLDAGLSLMKARSTLYFPLENLSHIFSLLRFFNELNEDTANGLS